MRQQKLLAHDQECSDIEAQATALHTRRNTGTCTPALIGPVLMRVCSRAARAHPPNSGDHDLLRQGESREARLLPLLGSTARGRVWRHVEGRARHLKPVHLDLNNHALLTQADHDHFLPKHLCEACKAAMSARCPTPAPVVQTQPLWAAPPLIARCRLVRRRRRGLGRGQRPRRILLTLSNLVSRSWQMAAQCLGAR